MVIILLKFCRETTLRQRRNCFFLFYVPSMFKYSLEMISCLSSFDIIKDIDFAKFLEILFFALDFL